MLYEVITADALGFEISPAAYTRLIGEDALLAPFTIKQVPPLFPRIEAPLIEEAPKAMPVDEKKQEKKAESSKPAEPMGDNLISYNFV